MSDGTKHAVHLFTDVWHYQQRNTMDSKPRTRETRQPSHLSIYNLTNTSRPTSTSVIYSIKAIPDRYFTLYIKILYQIGDVVIVIIVFNLTSGVHWPLLTLLNCLV
jgi:hypothetical protein